MKKRVLIGMSGGIDSTVAAILLQEQGYELVGATFRTFDSMKESCISKEKGCCSVESIVEAQRMAASLGFEHHILDFRDTFRAIQIQFTKIGNTKVLKRLVIMNTKLQMFQSQLFINAQIIL